MGLCQNPVHFACRDIFFDIYILTQPQSHYMKNNDAVPSLYCGDELSNYKKDIFYMSECR